MPHFHWKMGLYIDSILHLCYNNLVIFSFIIGGTK